MKIIKTNKQEEIFVDDEDYDWLSKHTWWYLSNGYAQTNIKHNNKWKTKLMHRLIMGVTDRWTLVDHINNNKIDNRRSNLRVCNQSENLRNRGLQKNNTSGIKGLSYCKQYNSWKATINSNKQYTKSFSCNIYPDAKERAIQWLKENREKLHGDFAKD
jgi:hypothetical protein